jgi:hypothetical protein
MPHSPSSERVTCFIAPDDTHVGFELNMKEFYFYVADNVCLSEIGKCPK